MPELPEVEIFTRFFTLHAIGRRISSVSILDDRILGAITRSRLRAALRGQTFTKVLRHGKHLFALAGKRWLRLHFGMSGDLSVLTPDQALPRFARAVFLFDDHTRLVFEDMRIFGVIELVSDPAGWIEEEGLGPDALAADLTLPHFRKALVARRGAIKALLMSQTLVAGLGNLYADEALWRCGINPGRPAETLSPEETGALYRSFRGVLALQVRRQVRGGDLPKGSLVHHRERGAVCPRCGGTIGRMTVGGRTTFYCTSHQN